MKNPKNTIELPTNPVRWCGIAGSVGLRSLPSIEDAGYIQIMMEATLDIGFSGEIMPEYLISFCEAESLQISSGPSLDNGRFRILRVSNGINGSLSLLWHVRSPSFASAAQKWLNNGQIPVRIETEPGDHPFANCKRHLVSLDSSTEGLSAVLRELAAFQRVSAREKPVDAFATMREFDNLVDVAPELGEKGGAYMLHSFEVYKHMNRNDFLCSETMQRDSCKKRRSD